MRTYRWVVFLFLCALSLNAFSESASKRAKRIEGMEGDIRGIYPDPYYIINDPGYKDGVIKIAVVRDSVRTAILNNYRPVPPICAIVPFPTWNNGEFIYNTESQSTPTRTDTPPNLLYSKTFTMVAENPSDTTDYDIVIKETYPKEFSGTESQSMCTFLYFRHKKLGPPIQFEVSSQCGINFLQTTEPLIQSQLRLFLIPLKNKDTEKTARLDFATRLYQEMLEVIQDPRSLIINRKRNYVFQKDPSLKHLEDQLLASLKGMDTDSATRALRGYKERFDYLEHMRLLAEIRHIRTSPTAKMGNRLALENGLVDVTYGRNYDLYHPDLKEIMLEQLDVRQQTIDELIKMNTHFASYISSAHLYGIEEQCLKNYKIYFAL